MDMRCPAVSTTSASLSDPAALLEVRFIQEIVYQVEAAHQTKIAGHSDEHWRQELTCR
jgi:hypothetical protein